MGRREKTVVGPTAQHVAAIHQEVPFQCRGVDPASVAGAERETRHLVLRQQRQEARIAVRRDAELILGEHPDKRIMRHPERVLRLGKRPAEIIGR